MPPLNAARVSLILPKLAVFKTASSPSLGAVAFVMPEGDMPSWFQIPQPLSRTEFHVPSRLPASPSPFVGVPATELLVVAVAARKPLLPPVTVAAFYRRLAIRAALA